MSSVPAIRKAELVDLPGIVRIYNQSVPDRNATCDLQLTTLEERIPWFHRHNARHPLWVAAEGERVIGWACISTYNEKAGYALTVENSVYVDKAFRGRGWGRRLLEHTIEESRRLKYHLILARIFAHNETSIALHLKLGFEEQGRLKEIARMDDTFYDVVYLVRFLTVE